jgi:hypothetical protein
VDPAEQDRLYVLGIQFHVSRDGGKTFLEGNGAKGTHADYHALWIDPRDGHHLVLGGDGGLNFTYDQGATWEYLKNLPVAQFYAIAVDQSSPYRVLGGLQDNGTWVGPSTTRDGAGISLARWSNLLGYDGYYCSVHPRDNDIVYAEGQYGMLYRLNSRTGASTYIRPRLESKDDSTNIVPARPKGTPEYRFNWSSPFLQSPYAQDEVFYGGNMVFCSRDRGDTWQVVSPDLTFGKAGPNDFRGHTLTTLAASPLEDHLLYAGSDDGSICVCRDWKKRIWTDLSQTLPDVPQERWITRLEASRFDKATVYLTLDRHRNGDCKPYVFRSTDFGLHWTSLAANLPDGGPVHVIREDPVNRDLLYVGTEFGLFVSLDGGKSWHKQKHLPTVPVHDLVIHPRERELVIGTHGRAIWIMDVLPLQELTVRALEKDLHLCSIRPASAHRQLARENLGIKNFSGTNAPYGAVIYAYCREPLKGATLNLVNEYRQSVAEFPLDARAGLHRVVWNLNHAGTKPGVYHPVPAGTYTAILRAGNRILQHPLPVEVEE